MSDYNIKIGVDSRSASAGVKSFSADLNSSLKALRDFDKKATDAFKSLNQFSKLNAGNLTKTTAAISAALNQLGQAKVSKALVTNLATLQKALAGLKVSNLASLRALPGILRSLNGAKISPQLASTLAALRGALIGFRGPSAAAVKNLVQLIQVMGSANAANINAVATALAKMNGLKFNVKGSNANPYAGMTNGAKGGILAMRGLQNQMSLTYHASTLLRAALGGLTFGSFVRDTFEAGNTFNNFVRQIGAVATSSAEVTQQIGFITDMVKRIPVSLEAAMAGYGKFAIATRLAGLSVKDTEMIFESFSGAFAVMGANADQQKYAFLALEQMVSKGAIQMQELKQQLGDNMPGAVQLLAKALDVSTPKLMKMIEAGEVGADKLKAFAQTVHNQFAALLPEAMKTAQSQFVNLSNAWTTLQQNIFNSGFEAGLASMASQLSQALGTKDIKDFGTALGNAFGKAFTYIGAIGRVLIENRDKVMLFVKAFAGFAAASAAISLAGSVLALVLVPLRLLATFGGLAATAIGSLGTAFMVIAQGKAITSIGNLGSALISLAKKPMMVALGIIAMSFAMDMFLQQVDKIAGTSLGGNFDALFNGLGKASDALMAKLSTLTKGMMGGEDLGGGFEKALAAATADYEKFSNKVLANEDLMKQNQKDQDKLLRDQAVVLSKDAQTLYDKVNAIGKANEEYQKQIVLLDEIATKRGMSPDQKANMRKVLDAQSLEDRNPLGAFVQDSRLDLATAKAKTGEQKALNDAKREELDLLKKGIVLNQAQVVAIADYYKGIAMMNGEIGNGIERWTTTVGDFNDNIQNAIKDGIGSLSDEITNFVTGAETDFAGLARSILKTFVQISLNSLMKDMFKGMGMDGETNGASMADQALAKLANIGDNITTAMTNVYTSGLAINGVPVGTGSMAASPELAGNREAQRRADYGTYGVEPITGVPSNGPIERRPLDDIPGSSVASPEARPDMADSIARSMAAGNEKLAARAAQEAANKAAYEVSKIGNTPLRGTISPPGTDLGLRGTISPTPSAAAPSTANIQQAVSAGVGSGFQRVVGHGAGFTDFMKGDGSTVRRTGTFAWRNNNPGNIEDGRFTQSQAGYMQGGGRFAAFDTLEHGRQARENLLFNSPGYRDKTLEQAISKYAPPFENNTKGYTSQLATAAGVSTQTRMRDMTEAQRRALMAKQEQVEGFRVGRETQLSGPRAGATATAVDPTTTQSITKLKTDIAGIGTAAQTTAPQVDQMKQKLTETGTTAQTASTQTQTSNSLRQSSDQQYGMLAAQTGVQVQTAGTAAASAGPQFQQAGSSIQQAGMAASTAGSQAQAGASGVGGFGQGISSLLGPLASAIPGLGQFGGMIMQLLQSLMGGGGGIGSMLGGLFEEGGISGHAVARASLPAGAWSGAPHYKDGTMNTSGGMPAVLHPNEAVIPLTRGRKVPVDMGDSHGREPGQEKVDTRPIITFNLNGVKDADTFKRSKRQIAANIDTAQRRASLRNN